MTEKVRMKIAIVLTTLFVGAVSAAGVVTHTPMPTPTPTVSASSVQKAPSLQPTSRAVPSSTREHENYD